MVGFVNVFVDPRVVFQSMDPVNEEIRKQQVKSHTRDKVRPTIFPHVLIQHALSPDLSQEPRKSQNVNDRRGDQGRFDLEPFLVLQESGVVFQPLVEEEEIRYRAEEKVEGVCAEEGNGEEG